MRMQIQALLRAAKGRSINILFPLVTESNEFLDARRLVLEEIEKEKKLKNLVPIDIKIGAMLETPSLAFSSDEFFQIADFISIGGNDLKQFFFAADRENELVRRRYDALNLSYLHFIKSVIQRCEKFNTPLSFCGEDAGRPLEALALSAIGLRNLSMRAASIGTIKLFLRSVSLEEINIIINNAGASGKASVREDLITFLRKKNIRI